MKKVLRARPTAPFMENFPVDLHLQPYPLSQKHHSPTPSPPRTKDCNLIPPTDILDECQNPTANSSMTKEKISPSTQMDRQETFLPIQSPSNSPPNSRPSITTTQERLAEPSHEIPKKILSNNIPTGDANFVVPPTQNSKNVPTSIRPSWFYSLFTAKTHTAKTPSRRLLPLKHRPPTPSILLNKDDKLPTRVFRWTILAILVLLPLLPLLVLYAEFSWETVLTNFAEKLDAYFCKS